jgi:TonB family protein
MRLAACVAVLATAASIVHAQDGAGSIGGTVEDQIGGPLGGALVTLTHGTTGAVRTTRTTSGATFEFRDLPKGVYSLDVTAQGFVQAQQSIDLEDQDSVSRAVVLRISDLHEVIRVGGNMGPALSERDRVALRNAEQAMAERASAEQARLCASSPRCVVPARKVVDARPQYPATSRANGVAGAVVLEARITPQGLVEDITELRNPDRDLWQAAVAAVQQWRFTPTRLNGVPVETLMSVTIEFILPE